MKSSFSKSRIYRALIILAITVCVVVVELIMLDSEQSSISNNVDAHVTEDARIADMLRIARLARENSSLADELRLSFKSAQDTVTVIEAVEHVGRKQGVEVIIDKAEKIKKDEDDQLLSVNAKVVGTWSSVYRFINTIDTFVYEHVTQKIVLSKNNGEENSMWEAHIEIQVPITTQ